MNLNDFTLSMEDIPPDTTPRFAYEEAESILDRFAQTQDDTYRRAWQKVKFMATAYAYADYWDDWPYDEPMNPALAIARGWEELQIAFTGRGEASISGAVWQLWDVIPNKKAEAAFMKAVKAAFKAAEEATPGNAKRLYLKKHRLAPLFHFMQQHWYPNVLMPNDGVRFRTWWQKDPEQKVEEQDDILEQLEWVEMADRDMSKSNTLMHWGKEAEA